MERPSPRKLVTTGLDPVARGKQGRRFGTVNPRIKSAGGGSVGRVPYDARLATAGIGRRRRPRPACDGFVLTPTTFPGMFEQFSRAVVPLLQKRGVFRKEYTGRPLREHLRGGRA